MGNGASTGAQNLDDVGGSKRAAVRRGNSLVQRVEWLQERVLEQADKMERELNKKAQPLVRRKAARKMPGFAAPTVASAHQHLVGAPTSFRDEVTYGAEAHQGQEGTVQKLDKLKASQAQLREQRQKQSKEATAQLRARLKALGLADEEAPAAATDKWSSHLAASRDWRKSVQHAKAAASEHLMARSIISQFKAAAPAMTGPVRLRDADIPMLVEALLEDGLASVATQLVRYCELAGMLSEAPPGLPKAVKIAKMWHLRAAKARLLKLERIATQNKTFNDLTVYRENVKTLQEEVEALEHREHLTKTFMEVIDQAQRWFKERPDDFYDKQMTEMIRTGIIKLPPAQPGAKSGAGEGASRHSPHAAAGDGTMPASSVNLQLPGSQWAPLLRGPADGGARNAARVSAAGTQAATTRTTQAGATRSMAASRVGNESAADDAASSSDSDAGSRSGPQQARHAAFTGSSKDRDGAQIKADAKLPMKNAQPQSLLLARVDSTEESDRGGSGRTAFDKGGDSGDDQHSSVDDEAEAEDDDDEEDDDDDDDEDFSFIRQTRTLGFGKAHITADAVHKARQECHQKVLDEKAKRLMAQELRRQQEDEARLMREREKEVAIQARDDLDRVRMIHIERSVRSLQDDCLMALQLQINRRNAQWASSESWLESPKILDRKLMRAGTLDFEWYINSACNTLRTGLSALLLIDDGKCVMMGGGRSVPLPTASFWDAVKSHDRTKVDAHALPKVSFVARHVLHYMCALKADHGTEAVEKACVVIAVRESQIAELFKEITSLEMYQVHGGRLYILPLPEFQACFTDQQRHVVVDPSSPKSILGPAHALLLLNTNCTAYHVEMDTAKGAPGRPARAFMIAEKVSVSSTLLAHGVRYLTCRMMSDLSVLTTAETALSRTLLAGYLAAKDHRNADMVAEVVKGGMEDRRALDCVVLGSSAPGAEGAVGCLRSALMTSDYALLNIWQRLTTSAHGNGKAVQLCNHRFVFCLKSLRESISGLYQLVPLLYVDQGRLRIQADLCNMTLSPGIKCCAFSDAQQPRGPSIVDKAMTWSMLRGHLAGVVKSDMVANFRLALQVGENKATVDTGNLTASPSNVSLGGPTRVLLFIGTDEREAIAGVNAARLFVKNQRQHLTIVHIVKDNSQRKNAEQVLLRCSNASIEANSQVSRQVLIRGEQQLAKRIMDFIVVQQPLVTILVSSQERTQKLSSVTGTILRHDNTNSFLIVRPSSRGQFIHDTESGTACKLMFHTEPNTPAMLKQLSPLLMWNRLTFGLVRSFAQTPSGDESALSRRIIRNADTYLNVYFEGDNSISTFSRMLQGAPGDEYPAQCNQDAVDAFVLFALPEKKLAPWQLEVLDRCPSSLLLFRAKA